MSHVIRLPLIAGLTVALLSANTAYAETPPSDRQLQAAVIKSLQDHHLVRGKDPQVEASGGTVMLSGQVRSLWEKEETIKWSRAVAGVKTLVSDLEIARAESDKKISDTLGERVLHYGRYTVFDDISGRVLNGAVTLEGAVTAEEKSNDIQEMAARIQGVQAVTNKLRVYPASQADDRLRAAVAQRIFGDPDLVRYAQQVNPPIHIIVEHGTVMLKGFVDSMVDKQRVDSRVRDIFGLQKLDNQLQISH
jgi:osmotically-inducible protein OsmY